MSAPNTERCPCCDSELTAWMNAWHETHGRKCGTCGLNFTDDQLARFRRTSDARVAEAVKPIWEVLHKHYPSIAGRVIGLERSGETVAHERWAALARDFYDAERTAHDLIDEKKKR